jgi:hypothetical protein
VFHLNVEFEELGLVPASSEVTGRYIWNWIRQKELFPFTNSYETVGNLHRPKNPKCNIPLCGDNCDVGVKLSLNVKTNVFLYLNNKNETAGFDPSFGSSSGQEILQCFKKCTLLEV